MTYIKSPKLWAHLLVFLFYQLMLMNSISYFMDAITKQDIALATLSVTLWFGIILRKFYRFYTREINLSWKSFKDFENDDT